MQNREQPNHGTKMNFYEGMPKRNFQQQGIANGCWDPYRQAGYLGPGF